MKKTLVNKHLLFIIFKYLSNNGDNIINISCPSESINITEVKQYWLLIFKKLVLGKYDSAFVEIDLYLDLITDSKLPSLYKQETTTLGAEL